jgi:single stranded DNA-binding protein
MRDIATATLSGNLTREVELRELPSGTPVARLRVATTTRRRHGEEWVEKTNYFTVEVYGGHARACGDHLATGSRVVVDAELDWRGWTDQHDHKREAVTLRARQVLFEGRRAAAIASDDQPDPTREIAARREAAGAPVGVGSVDGVGEASAEDLPF